jgi:hypothetical protein
MPSKNGRRWRCSSVTVSGRAQLRHAGGNTKDPPGRSPSRPDRRRVATARHQERRDAVRCQKNEPFQILSGMARVASN